MHLGDRLDNGSDQQMTGNPSSKESDSWRTSMAMYRPTRPQPKEITDWSVKVQGFSLLSEPRFLLLCVHYLHRLHRIHRSHTLANETGEKDVTFWLLSLLRSAWEGADQIYGALEKVYCTSLTDD